MGESDSIFSSGRGKVQAWDGTTEASSEPSQAAADYAPTQGYAQQHGGRRARAAKVSTPSPVADGEPVQQQTIKKKGNRGCLIAVIVVIVLAVVGPLITAGAGFLGVFLDDAGFFEDDSSNQSEDYQYSDYTEITDADEKAIATAAEPYMAQLVSGEYGDLSADLEYLLYVEADGLTFEQIGINPDDVEAWALEDSSYEFSYATSEEACVCATFEVEHRSFYEQVIYKFWDTTYDDRKEMTSIVTGLVEDALASTETTTDYVDIKLVRNDAGEWEVVPLSVEYAYRYLHDLD